MRPACSPAPFFPSPLTFGKKSTEKGHDHGLGTSLPPVPHLAFTWSCSAGSRNTSTLQLRAGKLDLWHLILQEGPELMWEVLRSLGDDSGASSVS